MNRKSLRVAAAALSLCAVSGLSVGSSAVAFAAPATNSNIDTTAPVSLNIHKYQGPTVNCTNDGTDQTACVNTAGAKALSGAVFTVTQVLYNGAPIDLKTNAGWAEASYFMQNWHGSPLTGTLLTDASGGKYTLGTATVSSATDATGLTTLSGLTDSLYIVQETTAPTSTSGSYTPAAPFAVTLPMATADGTGWIYNVNAYPKNNLASITKSVTDQGTSSLPGTNSTVKYTTASTIDPGYVTSTATSGTVLKQYTVSDTFDSRLTNPNVADVYLQGSSTSKTLLTAGTDYTVAINGQSVVVNFTQAGLDKLVTAQAADPTAKVYVDWTATLAAGVTGDIPNTASFVPNQNVAKDANGNPIPTPSNTVDSKYVDLTLTKDNNVATTNPLQGAKFDLYQTNDCSATGIASATKLATGASTDATGTITWKGLQASDFYNGSTQTTLQNYCVVETVAPVGYILPSNPYTAVSLPQTSAGTAVTIKVVNQETQGNQLPLTGGQGIAGLSIAGFVLVGGGVGYYAFTSRRRNSDND